MDLTAYEHVPTQILDAAGVRYAWRRYGVAGGVPLVLVQRFRGTMDHWDPALLDRLAAHRELIVFDNAGVGLSTGTVAPDIAGAARAAAAFIDALGLAQVDLLGWSMGGAIAQRITLDRPARVRRLVLAGTGPGGVPDAPPPPAKVWQVAARPVNDDEDFLYLFYADTPTSRAAGLASLRRIDRRLSASRAAVAAASWQAQAGAIAAWGQGRDSAWARLHEIRQPVLVANGAHDVMVHAYNSYAMSQRLADAQLVLYPDAGHGFLFQHAERYAADVTAFLDRPGAVVAQP